MCEVNDYIGVLFALFAVLEFWLGRTNIVQSGSTLELVLNLIKSYVNLRKPK